MKGLVCFVLALALAAVNGANTLTRIGSFPLKHAAFSQLYENSNAKSPAEKYSLLISTFGAPSLFSSASDSVTVVKNIGSHFDDIPSIRPEVITTKTVWPNEISRVPDGIFNEDMLVIPDGFLVPFKTNGNIKLMDITNGNYAGPFSITNGGSWFYHRVQWYDMDGDGDQDIITCRAREPVIPVVFGREDEELIWLENPSGNYKVEWNAHVLAHGPDTFFRFTQMSTPDGMKECIFAAQFFTKSLSVYWTKQDGGLFTDTSMLTSRVIDDTIGSVFEVDIVDVNNDGRLDLLVTTNGANGTLLAYEIPDDFRTGQFIKHTIAVGFIPRQSGTGKGAPGNVITVYPTTTNNTTKPVIILSGDDDGRAYSFEATSETPSDWSYNQVTFCDAGSGTVGEISAADVNGDGYTDVFVPSYTTNEVFVYSYQPRVPMTGAAIG